MGWRKGQSHIASECLQSFRKPLVSERIPRYVRNMPLKKLLNKVKRAPNQIAATPREKKHSI